MSPIKIMICDDELDVVNTLAELIELEYNDKVEIFKITDSIDALVAITETKFDLIITDFKMPKLNGIELIQNIYTINSSLNKDTPVFIVTGNAPEMQDKNNIIQDKNIVLVSKPVRSEMLAVLINKTLKL